MRMDIAVIWSSERRLMRHCAIYGAEIDLAGLLSGVVLGIYERRRRRDGIDFPRFLPYAVQKWVAATYRA